MSSSTVVLLVGAIVVVVAAAAAATAAAVVYSNVSNVYTVHCVLVRHGEVVDRRGTVIRSFAEVPAILHNLYHQQMLMGVASRLYNCMASVYNIYST